MNFKSLKKIMILAVVPLMLTSGGNKVLAGGGASTMRNGGTGKQCSYSVSSSEKRYATHDMSRIVYKTFNYTKCGKYDDNLFGPWRFMAYKKVEHDPKFENLIPQETERQVESENRLRMIANRMCWDPCLAGTPPPPRKEVVLMTADDPDFKYMYHVPTENEDFEKAVEECRKEWNFAHGYKEPICNPEEALEKALRILKSAFEDKDPFCNKPVKVSYDPIKRVYQIEPISKYTISEAHAERILLGANGDVISMDLRGNEDLLRRLV